MTDSKSPETDTSIVKASRKVNLGLIAALAVAGTPGIEMLCSNTESGKTKERNEFDAERLEKAEEKRIRKLTKRAKR